METRQEQMPETMRETIRRLREEAWDAGYAARDQRNPRLRATWKNNPYRITGPCGHEGVKNNGRT